MLLELESSAEQRKAVATFLALLPEVAICQWLTRLPLGTDQVFDRVGVQPTVNLVKLPTDASLLTDARQRLDLQFEHPVVCLLYKPKPT